MKWYVKANQSFDFNRYSKKIEDDEQFEDAMVDFGEDVCSIVHKIDPSVELGYNQDGQGGDYLNTFYDEDDNEVFFISDAELYEFDNYADILEYTVKNLMKVLK